jgi:hypothetical protein
VNVVGTTTYIAHGKGSLPKTVPGKVEIQGGEWVKGPTVLQGTPGAAPTPTIIHFKPGYGPAGKVGHGSWGLPCAPRSQQLACACCADLDGGHSGHTHATVPLVIRSMAARGVTRTVPAVAGAAIYAYPFSGFKHDPLLQLTPLVPCLLRCRLVLPVSMLVPCPAAGMATPACSLWWVLATFGTRALLAS